MEVKTLLRAEDVLTMGDQRVELVKGELLQMTPTGMEHGGIVSTLTVLVGGYVRAHQLGRTYGAETGVILTRDPDTVRAPDLMFIAAARLKEHGDLAGFSDLVPDLAIEVVSPHDYWGAVEEKVAEYLAAEVRLVWVVSPKTKSVHVYRPGNEVLRLSGDDELSGADVLPGLALKVSELFA
jgi:Uma2 family endonuclease